MKFRIAAGFFILLVLAAVHCMYAPWQAALSGAFFPSSERSAVPANATNTDLGPNADPNVDPPHAAITPSKADMKADAKADMGQPLPLPSSKIESVGAELHLRVLMKNQPNLRDLDHELRHQKIEDLQAALRVSQETVSAHHLLEKAQVGPMSDLDQMTLALEMRRQAVIQHLLMQAGLERIKRKAL